MWLKSRQLYRVLATRPRVASAATSSPLVKSHRTTVTSQSVAAADQPPDAHPHPTPLQTASPLEEKCVSDSQLATIPEHLKLFNLIKAYESEGHLIANLDPLQNAQLDPRRAPFVLEQVDILRKEYYGFKESDLTKQFHIGTQLPTLGPICTLKQVLRKLRQAYCGSVGIEFTHIIDKERRLWISHQVWQMCTRQDLYNRHTIARLRRIAKEGRCPPPASSLLTASGGLAPASRTESGLDQALAGEAQPPNQHEQVLGSVGVTDEVDRASRAEQLQTLELLAHTVRFETFCSERFSGAKRFGVEGCETLIPGLKAALDRAAHNGVQCVEMGMAHRGRLNVLHNVLQVPFETIAEKFQPLLPDDGELPSNSDDVRYHLGCLVDYCTPTRTLHVSLASNPSHLEAVNAVVLGKTRARQFLQRGGAQEDRAAIVDGVVTPTGASTSDALGRGVQRPTTNNSGPLGMRGSVDYSPGDCARKEVMALLVHGDASFFQGSVRESLGFANLRDYSTGGTVHVIVNNQIGFTTMPKESHSSVYCSDVAKATGAPVFHVNGDDPDAVVHVFKLAVDYRQAFERDVVVNLWGYRRHGHNEQDTPELTQPVMYNTIKKHTPVTELYFESLLKEGAVEADHLERLYDRIDDELAQCCSILEREVESEATCGQGRAKIDAKGREQEHKVGSIGGGGGDLREKGEAVGKHLKQSVLGFWHELRQAWPSESQRQQEQEQGGEQQPQHRSSRETRSDGGMMADAAGQALGGGGAESSLPNAACEVETVGRQSAAPPSQVQSLQEAQDLCLLDQVRTGVHLSALRTIGEAVFTLPPSDIFCAHARVIDIYDKRLKALSTGQGIRWADAEALAFASLLSQGFHVRLSGQDVERGTFNQRHAVVYDQVRSLHTDEVIYKPWTGLQGLWDRGVLPDMGSDVLAKHHNPEADSIKRGAHWREMFRREKGLPPSLGVMEVCNSPLSEEAVLGFEHGVSLVSNHILVVWEAQFGDFSNCAQTIIDTFVASGEAKWMRSCCLVMLLPHGYEGQGADHSSAKIERFLQLCNDDMDLGSEGNSSSSSNSNSINRKEDDGEPVRNETNRDLASSEPIGKETKSDNMSLESEHSQQHQRQRQQDLQAVLYQQAEALKQVNMHVVNCSTPAQHFHVLRRQMLLPMRKPLVAFTPKSLLHHKPCASDLSDFSRDARFEAVLCHWEPGGIASVHPATTISATTNNKCAESCDAAGVGGSSGSSCDNAESDKQSKCSNPAAVQQRVHGVLASSLYPVSTLTQIPVEAWRDGTLESPKLVLFCSGKIRYQLARKRKALKLEDSVVIVSVEQLCPFPVGSIWQLLECLLPPSDTAAAVAATSAASNSGANLPPAPMMRLRWVQEEPRNMGAWTFAKPRLERCVSLMRARACDPDAAEYTGVSGEVEYVGRPSAAYPATGSFAQHLDEMGSIMTDAFDMT